MIKFEETLTGGWEAAIRGMRNPMNSWDKSDTNLDRLCCIGVGPNDYDLMMRLAKAGPVHAKYRRMINVTVDITAPLYWWKEFDTYKIGTVANSCSTMHKISAKEFTEEDFSCEHLFDFCPNNDTDSMTVLRTTIDWLNVCREKFLETKDKNYWWQMIQLLPSSYNQKRTVQLNYEVLSNIYTYRKDHKLDEWRDLCKWIKHSLPYPELIIGEEGEE